MEPKTLFWKTTGILKNSTEILDDQECVVGSLTNKSAFKHRTIGAYADEKMEFDYDGSFFNNVDVFDPSGTAIGKYEAVVMVDEGTYFDFLLNENFDFRRNGKFYQYTYSIRKAGAEIVHYEITDQSFAASSGTIRILDHVHPRIILVGLYLAAYNKSSAGD